MKVDTNITAITMNNLEYSNGSGNLPKVAAQPSSPAPDQTETRALITKPTYNRNQQRVLCTKGRFVDSYV